MSSVDISLVLLLLLICAGGGFVQRVSGFGLGIFVMLFLPHLLPSHTMAATMAGMLSIFTSSYNAIKYCKQVSYRTVLPLILSAFAVIPIAVYFSAVVPARLFQILLGVVLIGLSIYFLFFNSRLHLKPTIRNAVFAGVLGGTLNGLFSTGGPPIVLYLTHAMTDKLTYFATIQFYFALSNLGSTVIRAANGLLTPLLLFYAAIGIVGAFIGNWIGNRVFEKLNGERLKQIIYIGMIASGVSMLV